jgi:hypothetical protein
LPQTAQRCANKGSEHSESCSARPDLRTYTNFHTTTFTPVHCPESKSIQEAHEVAHEVAQIGLRRAPKGDKFVWERNFLPQLQLASFLQALYTTRMRFLSATNLRLRRFAAIGSGGVALAMMMVVACTSTNIGGECDENDLECLARRPGAPDGSVDPNADPEASVNRILITPAERAAKLFEELAPDLKKNCGVGCHDTATNPIAKANLTFLAPPDAYKTIRGYPSAENPSIVVRDVEFSQIFLQGQHSGPALAAYPELELKVLNWLRQESAAMIAQKFPSSLPTALDANMAVDMSPAGSIPNVQVVFGATEIAGAQGGIRLDNLRMLVPPQGSATKGVRIKGLRFVRVKADGTEQADSFDVFGSLDRVFGPPKATVRGDAGADSGPPITGAELTPEKILLIGGIWAGTKLGVDKIRIELRARIEVADLSQAQIIKCNNVAGFTTTIKPLLVTGTTNQSCLSTSCHGGAIKSPDMALANKEAELCANIKGYLDPGDPDKSSILLKPTEPTVTHRGDKVVDLAGFRKKFKDSMGRNGIFYDDKGE